MADAYPDEFNDLTKSAADNYRDDIEGGVDFAYRRWSKSELFAQFTERMVRDAIRAKIYERRHAVNVQIRREAGFYGGKAKVSSGSSVVNEVARNILTEYSIAGITLGRILGSNLFAIAEAEEARAEGHLFNMRVCERLAKIVPADKTVAQAVSVMMHGLCRSM